MAEVIQVRHKPAALLHVWRPPRVSARRAYRLWRRNLTLYRRVWIWNMLPNFFQPFMYFVALGVGLGVFVGRQIEGFEYMEFIAPGLAAMAAMYGAAFELTFNTFIKLEMVHLYDAVLTTPLEPEDIAAGEIAWGTTRAFTHGISFLIVMVILGHIGSVAGGLLAVGGIALVGLTLGLVSVIYTNLIKSIDHFGWFFNLVLLPLFLFSGVFFPITVLPQVAQTLAWYTPLYHGVEMMRALTLTGDFSAAAGHALWQVVFCLILLPPAINLFRRKLVV